MGTRHAMGLIAALRRGALQAIMHTQLRGLLLLDLRVWRSERAGTDRCWREHAACKGSVRCGAVMRCGDEAACSMG